MRAINHALTGAVIGASLGRPLIAVPLAVASHFLLDAIPHFGIDRSDIVRRWFMVLLCLDVLLCVGLVIVLAAFGHGHWLTAIVCAFSAACPDFMSIPLFYRTKRYGNTSRESRYPLMRLHDRIQTELPEGAVIELVWAGIMIVLLRHYVG